MEHTTLRRIAKTLTKSKKSKFYSEGEISFCDIKVEVEGVGELTFPLTVKCVEKLKSISSKSHQNVKKKSGKNVHHTQAIASDRLRVTIKEQSLSRMINKMRDALELDEEVDFIPHLHNMVIKGPGGCSSALKNAENSENAFVTLVIVLPSSHIGGELFINYGKKEHMFSSEDTNAGKAKYIAFYGDCDNNVEEIEEGYRVVLTYNLVSEVKESSGTEYQNPELKSAIAKYFASKSKKLVYLLDHIYMKHSLRWASLKGTDQANASAIRMVAKELGLVPYLALVTVDQLLSSADGGKPLLMQEDSILSDWVDEDDKTVQGSICQAEEEEICWTKATKSAFKPYNTKVEIDEMHQYYKRAAIVLWSSQTLINFTLDYDNAANELYAVIKAPGNEKKAIELAGEAGKSIYNNRKFSKSNVTNLDLTVEIALYIKDEVEALKVLSNIDWRLLNSDRIDRLLMLQTQYGPEWLATLMSSDYTSEMPYNMKILFSYFLDKGIEKQVLGKLLDVHLNYLMETDNDIISFEANSYFFPSNRNTYSEIILICVELENIEVLSKVVEHMISIPKLYSEVYLYKKFLEIKNISSPEYYTMFQNCLIKCLNDRIISLPDWSIKAPLPCKCEQCEAAKTFLFSKTDKSRIWFITEEISKHISESIKSCKLPVDLSVDKSSTEYKVIMTKTKAITEETQKKISKTIKFKRYLKSKNIIH